MLQLPTYDDVAAAAQRLTGHAHRTPVMQSATANALLSHFGRLGPSLLHVFVPMHVVPLVCVDGGELDTDTHHHGAESGRVVSKPSLSGGGVWRGGPRPQPIEVVWDVLEPTGYICRLAHGFPQRDLEDIFKMARQVTHLLSVLW